jgi:hypothetical protein
MYTFKIEFQDNEQNELWSKSIEADYYEEAKEYADLVLAETSHNDLFTFKITQL